MTTDPHAAQDRPILPPFDPLEVRIASMIATATRRGGGSQASPSMAEIHGSMHLARRIIAVVRSP
jgi:hypothetical protein